jgi:hypothetical protein
MFCQKNFLTVSNVIVANGLASIHLVKYSTAIIANLFPLAKVEEVQPDPCPTFAVAMSVFDDIGV